MWRKMLFTTCLYLVICFCACAVFSQNTQSNMDSVPTQDAALRPKPDMTQLQLQLKQMEAEIKHSRLDIQQLIDAKLTTVGEEIEHASTELNNQLQSQERKIEEVRITASANKEVLSCHFTIVTWFTVVVICLVGLFGGIVAWVAYKKEDVIYKRLNQRAEKAFDRWQAKTEDLLQKDFSNWLKVQKELFEKKIDLEQTYMMLACLFEPPKQPSDDIFSSVRLISDSKRKIYRPLLMKIAQAEGVDERVKQVAEEGLSKLDAL